TTITAPSSSGSRDAGLLIASSTSFSSEPHTRYKWCAAQSFSKSPAPQVPIDGMLPFRVLRSRRSDFALSVKPVIVIPFQHKRILGQPAAKTVHQVLVLMVGAVSMLVQVAVAKRDRMHRQSLLSFDKLLDSDQRGSETERIA